MLNFLDLLEYRKICMIFGNQSHGDQSLTHHTHSVRALVVKSLKTMVVFPGGPLVMVCYEV